MPGPVPVVTPKYGMPANWDQSSVVQPNTAV